jgi:hypothetical protein
MPVLEGPNPTATQDSAVGHETAASPVTDAGTGLEAHVCPPSLVVRMSLVLSPRASMPPPTTTQLSAVGQAIALREVVPEGGTTEVQVPPPSVLAEITPAGVPSPGVASPARRH